MAGAWTVLVHQQDRKKAMSSTQPARFGIRSETSRPDWPYFLKVRVLARSGVSPLVNWLTGRPKLSGSGLPCCLSSSGLGRRDRWAGAADHEQEDYRFRLRLEVRRLARSGIGGSPLTPTPLPRGRGSKGRRGSAATTGPGRRSRRRLAAGTGGAVAGRENGGCGGMFMAPGYPGGDGDATAPTPKSRIVNID